MKVSIPVKYVVPDLEKKCRNYDRARTALFCTFFLFFPAIILMIILPKWAQYHRLNNFVKSVKTQDKVLLLPYLGYIQNSKEIAQALIDTGNLADYHLVAGIMLVKNGVEVSEAEAIAEYSAMFNPQAAAVMEKAASLPELCGNFSSRSAQGHTRTAAFTSPGESCMDMEKTAQEESM